MIKKYYFDHAATTPLDSSVLKVMKPFLETEYANPSSIYSDARTTRLALENARKSVADTLGAKPTEIIFTSGGTEGNNLAIQGVFKALGLHHCGNRLVVRYHALIDRP